ncbi:MAG: S8 family serine peptidase [Streptosporangiales bacterium]|nr:S8 family serine peptidase [Streptosporangiales bacterium]
MAVVTVAVTGLALAGPAQAAPDRSSPDRTGTADREYIVVYTEGASAGAARAAIRDSGGTLVRENAAVGVATVRSSDPGFADAADATTAISGVAANRSIGAAPSTGSRDRKAAVEKAGRGVEAGTKGRPSKPGKGEEPLADLQWDMKMIHATAGGSHKVEPGDRGVLVGVLDTGIDGSHPDIAPNFDRRLSRNFTVDIPVDANGQEIDGPCEEEADRSCNDPADEDPNDHGTHTSSAIVAARNGLGIAGVAPNVRVANLRAGQDSGFFFTQATVDALTYAGDVGVDVVNMSFFVDPWLFNCTDNPADSAADRREQATIVKAVQRALTYARGHGVTLVNSAGNEAADYSKEFVDTGSPNFADTPGEAPRERTIPPSCISMPSEGEGVIAISSLGISKRKAYYSSYGVGHADLSSPGGDAYDTADQKVDLTRTTLAAYPKALAEERGELNPDGTPNVNYLVRDCKGDTCAYYQWLQGTSMAAPRAAGVAALIVSKYGKRDKRHGGLTLDPRATERILRATATNTACPEPREFTYTRFVAQPDGTFRKVVSTATCEGGRGDNGFYGDGIVDALRAVG